MVLFLLENRDFLGFRMIFKVRLMALFLLEDRDFKGFWMKIWNAGVSVITRSTFSSLNLDHPGRGVQPPGSDVISIISFVLGAMCTNYTKEHIQ